MPATSAVLFARSITRKHDYFKQNTPIFKQLLPPVLKDKLPDEGKGKKGLKFQTQNLIT